MRKYIDCIRVTNIDLAYAIIEALEKNDNYSVDFFDKNESLARRGDGPCEIELRVFRNEKVTVIPPMGFSQEDKKDAD